MNWEPFGRGECTASALAARGRVRAVANIVAEHSQGLQHAVHFLHHARVLTALLGKALRGCQCMDSSTFVSGRATPHPAPTALRPIPAEIHGAACERRSPPPTAVAAESVRGPQQQHTLHRVQESVLAD